MIMSPRRKGLLGVKENEKTLDGTGNPILNRKEGINTYSVQRGAV